MRVSSLPRRYFPEDVKYFFFLKYILRQFGLFHRIRSASFYIHSNCYFPFLKMIFYSCILVGRTAWYITKKNHLGHLKRWPCDVCGFEFKGNPIIYPIQHIGQFFTGNQFLLVAMISIPDILFFYIPTYFINSISIIFKFWKCPNTLLIGQEQTSLTKIVTYPLIAFT